jgi:hypothetical protein
MVTPPSLIEICDLLGSQLGAATEFFELGFADVFDSGFSVRKICPEYLVHLGQKPLE